MTDMFDIIFDGDLVQGVTESDARRNLAALFKVSPDKITPLFSAKPVRIKRNLDEVTVHHWLVELEQAGIRCRLAETGVFEREQAAAANTGGEMTCPKCGFKQPKSVDCIRCGVVVEKFLERRKQEADAFKIVPKGRKAKINLDQARDTLADYGRRITNDKIHLAPDIPAKKLANARKAYAQTTPDEEVLALVDITVFGGAKDGMVLTDRRLYCHELMQEPASFDLHDIADIRLDLGVLNHKVMINGVQALQVSLDMTQGTKLFLKMIRHLAGVPEIAEPPSPPESPNPPPTPGSDAGQSGEPPWLIRGKRFLRPADMNRE